MSENQVVVAEPLTVLASRYAAIKAQVAAELRPRQVSSRFGASPAGDDGPTLGKRDARAEAARRLGAGVSHGTLEKVVWLQAACDDSDAPLRVRLAALEALESIDAGERVDWLYAKVHAFAMTEQLRTLAGPDETDPVVRTVAGIGLGKVLKARDGNALPAALDREARKAMAAVRLAQRGGQRTGKARASHRA